MTRPNRRLSGPPRLSVGVNLSFQAALRAFADAQRRVPALPAAPDYAALEREADTETAALILTIDALIERREMIEQGERIDPPLGARMTRSKEIRLKEIRQKETREKQKMNQRQPTPVPPAEQYALVAARLQQLAEKQGILPEGTRASLAARTPESRTHFLLAALSAACVAIRRPSLGLMDQALAGDTSALLSALAGDAPPARAVARARRLLALLVFDGCRQREEI